MFQHGSSSNLQEGPPRVLFLASVFAHLSNFHSPLMFMLKEMQCEILAAARFDGHEEKLITAGITCWNVDFDRSPYGLTNIRAFSQLIRLFKANHFDLIHVHTPVAAFLGRFVAKRTGQGPVMYTAHGFHFYKGAPLHNWLIYYPAEKLATKWTDALVVMNREDMENAERRLGFHLGHDLFRVHGVGVDTGGYSKFESEDECTGLTDHSCSRAVWRSKHSTSDGSKVEVIGLVGGAQMSGESSVRYELGIGSEDIVFACIGELNQNKNQSFLLDAWKKVANQRTNAHLLLVGDGHLAKSLEQSVREHSIPNVYFLGFRNDVPDILDQTDTLVHVSKREGLPRVIMEAMAASKPVIATNIRGNRDLVQDGVNGLLVEVGNVPAIESAMITLIDNGQLRVSMGINGFKMIQDYSIDRVLDEMRQIYARLLGLDEKEDT